MTLEEIFQLAQRIADDDTLPLDLRDCAEELAELAAGTRAPWSNQRVDNGVEVRS